MKNTVFLGCSMAAVAVFLIATMNMFAKLSSAYLDPIEIVFYRGVFCLACLLGWLVITGRYDLLKTSRPVAHLGRSIIGNVGVCMVFWAYALLPMASATTILLASGITITLLSVLFLGERVGIWRWGAVACGLVGCLIAIDPLDSKFNLLGTVVALGAMTTTALVSIFLRDMGRTEHPFTTVFYFVLAAVLAMGVYMIFRGSVPPVQAFWPLIGVGAASLGSLMVKTYAYKFAEASVISPIYYSSLVWATLYGWTIWGEIPSLAVISGAVLIVGSNAVIVWREASRARSKIPSKPIEE